MINKPIIYKLFKDFTNHTEKTNRVIVFRLRFLLKYRDHSWNLPAILKIRFFEYLFKTSASIYESKVLQFFRTTTGIQSGPDAFDKLKLVMTFLTNLGITGILCIFWVFLEGEAGKEIPRHED